MEAYIGDWLNLLLRWLHLIAGIAWIGASFYFVMLDNSLKPPRKLEDANRGVSGELWAVHGGGFYCSQKFLTGPKRDPLSEDLHWSKWEAYTTWLSGMGLLAIVYWHGASAYLIDTSVADLSPYAGVALSVAFLVGGWLAYDKLCKRIKDDKVLAAVISGLIVFAVWGLFQLFSPRAAYIHVGAMIGTIMVANVFFVIIPGQKRMVAAIRAGQEPDREPGLRGKQRSVHNTYFTLPVLFTMISHHFPMTYGHDSGWLVLVTIMLAGALIRQFFVLRHQGQVKIAYPVVGSALLLALAVAIAPNLSASSTAGDSARAVSFTQVHSVIAQRCATCHSANPTDVAFPVAPGGVMFDTPDQIKAQATRIHQRTVVTRDMPLGNMTQMTAEERALLGAWFSQGAEVDE